LHPGLGAGEGAGRTARGARAGARDHRPRPGDAGAGAARCAPRAGPRVRPRRGPEVRALRGPPGRPRGRDRVPAARAGVRGQGVRRGRGGGPGGGVRRRRGARTERDVRPGRGTAVAALATVLVAALGAAAIAGCDGARRSEAPAGAAGAADTAEGGAGGPGAVRSSGPASTAGAAAPLPADTGDAEAAAAVIRSYYDAIARRDYASAYRLWAGQGAASGQSYEEFRRGYAETAAVEVAIGEPGRVEGAAGSRYVQVPVEIRARTTAGADQCFRGTYTLVRSVVPGATAEQRR